MVGKSTTHSELTIREARLEDGEVIGRYAAELMSLHHGWDPRRFIAPDSSTPEKYARYLTSQIGRKNVVVLVAQAGGQVIGYCYGANEGPDYMSLRGPGSVVHDIFVDERSRGCGIGRRLLQAAVATLTGLGATQIVLSTAYLNEAGQRFFRSAGFRPTMVEMTI